MVVRKIMEHIAIYTKIYNKSISDHDCDIRHAWESNVCSLVCDRMAVSIIKIILNGKSIPLLIRTREQR